jgi:predicted RNA methylase
MPLTVVNAAGAFGHAANATWRGVADMVICNPPFGAWSKGADLAFLRSALQVLTVAANIQRAASACFFAACSSALLHAPLGASTRRSWHRKCILL